VFAVQFDHFGSPGVLALRAFPEPHAGPGQVRIRVRAAGVSPVDVAIRAGTSPSAKTLALPHVPGVDAAGTVDELGEGVSDVSIGDEVFGTVEIERLGGATAEFAVLSFWALKPESMPSTEAGAAGSSVETATRC
jgi:NADPH:quinone reductase-like Zn-dependent oxidoreductase